MSVRQRLQRRALPLYQDGLRRLHDLNYLFIELTHRCNLNCLHCGSDCTRDDATPDLDIEAVLRTMQEVASAYDPHGISVVLSGGEPLAHPGVFDLGAGLTRLGFPWGMVTNGFAWSDRHREQARRAGMRTVTVSLDGLEPEHDWLRNRSGSFRRASAAIEAFAAADWLQAMDVITCANQRNLPTLDGVRQHLIELGVQGWRIFTISPIGRARQMPELRLQPSQYQELMNRILGWREQGGIHVALSESGYLGPCLEHEVRDHHHFCGAGVNISGIMVDGSILACPNIDRRFAQGNIHHESFVDVWEHRYQPFRQRDWMRKGACVSCGEWAQCKGGSLHLWDLDEDRHRLCHYEDFELADFHPEPR